MSVIVEFKVYDLLSGLKPKPTLAASVCDRVVSLAYWKQMTTPYMAITTAWQGENIVLHHAVHMVNSSTNPCYICVRTGGLTRVLQTCDNPFLCGNNHCLTG